MADLISCDEVMLGEWWSLPNPTPGVLTRRQPQKAQKHRERAEIGAVRPQAWSHQRLEQAGEDPPRSPQAEHGPADTWIWASGLQTVSQSVSVFGDNQCVSLVHQPRALIRGLKRKGRGTHG